MASVHKGDVGTVITLETTKDISSDASPEIHVKKPSGGTAVWVGSVSGTTAIEYTTIADDLDEIGVYELWAFATLQSGTWHGDKVEMPVLGIDDGPND